MASRALVQKLLILACVTLALSFVLMRIGWLVDERQQRQQAAVANVEQSQAGAQLLLGPLLLRQCSESWDVVTGEGKARVVSVDKRDGCGRGKVCRACKRTAFQPQHRAPTQHGDAPALLHLA